MKCSYFTMSNRTYRVTREADCYRPYTDCLESWNDPDVGTTVHEWDRIDHGLQLIVFDRVFDQFIGWGKHELKIVEAPFLRQVLYQTSEGKYYRNRYEAAKAAVYWTAPLVVQSRDDLPVTGTVPTKSFVPLLFRANRSLFRTPRMAHDKVGSDCEIEVIPVVIGAHLPFHRDGTVPMIVDGNATFWITGDPL